MKKWQTLPNLSVQDNILSGCSFQGKSVFPAVLVKLVTSDCIPNPAKMVKSACDGARC